MKFYGRLLQNAFDAKCFDFGGRASRSEFWVVFVFINSIFLIVYTIAEFVPGFANVGLLIVFLFAGPYLAVGCRRLHDINRAGWWQLFRLIPLVGEIILAVFWCIPGTIGKNNYGPDPLEAQRQQQHLAKQSIDEKLAASTTGTDSSQVASAKPNAYDLGGIGSKQVNSHYSGADNRALRAAPNPASEPSTASTSGKTTLHPLLTIGLSKFVILCLLLCLLAIVSTFTIWKTVTGFQETFDECLVREMKGVPQSLQKTVEKLCSKRLRKEVELPDDENVSFRWSRNMAGLPDADHPSEPMPWKAIVALRADPSLADEYSRKYDIREKLNEAKNGAVVKPNYFDQFDSEPDAKAEFRADLLVESKQSEFEITRGIFQISLARCSDARPVQASAARPARSYRGPTIYPKQLRASTTIEVRFIGGRGSIDWREWLRISNRLEERPIEPPQCIRPITLWGRYK